jgi:predicted O-methyltransferase YrrM
MECKTDGLRRSDALSPAAIFGSPEIASTWSDASRAISQFEIPEDAGGVNPGDRRAIYYLISAIRPASVLEIGTHIGASTVHIAAALASVQATRRPTPTLTTVDIADVNSRTEGPWATRGASCSPIEMIEKLQYGHFVKFVTSPSLRFAATCQQTFDFIFLDGDHAARTVYQEIPAALRLLNEDGIVLLHDYFPRRRPLWKDGTVIPGPLLATERLREEGAQFIVAPLGALPWPTKLHSNVTSLALLLKASQ